ncbi:hypothetical protein [Variovorax sp. W2I14]|uniref:hypothetical protein n=1 Tax=Variovorax sp. W2I14 TaxID=3042290 RepID=UPI003D247F2F
MSQEEIFERVEMFLDEKMKSIQLDEDAKLQIALYLENREYEMAFEGFFLELMNSEREIELDPQACTAMALGLRLDRETVFDSDFWARFQEFMGKSIRP